MTTNYTFSYYPGCTLKTKAKELDRYARLSAEALGIELRELENWQCCGAVYPMAKDEVATKLSSVRALDDAKKEGNDLITLCSACHNVIKQVNHDMQTDTDIASKANNYLALDEEYAGETRVMHYLEMLRDIVGFDKIAECVKNPLEGKRVGAYYGCLLLRPSDVMQMDNPENPKLMEDLIKALGGEPVIYPMRNECCGGYVTMEEKELAAKKSGDVLASAEENKAEIIVTACPLCLYNLNNNADNSSVKTIYFTELLAEALGVKENALDMSREAADE